MTSPWVALGPTLGYEKVYTVTDYYDGEVQGVADLDGKPHFYDRIWDPSNSEYSNLFRLTPISQERFQLALEDWEIWLRWEHAFHNRHIGPEPHGVLPEDSARHEEIKLVLDAALKTNEESCITCEGIVEVIPCQSFIKGSMRPLQVRWKESKTN